MREDLDDENTENDDLFESFDEGDLNADVDTKTTIEKADRSLSELHDWHRDGDIVIDPEWQRNYVWDRIKASKLIESFLLDIPVPVVYLARNESGKYEVIDGLQRLTSVFDYFEGKFKLTRLDFRKDIDDRLFKELKAEDQKKLKRAILRTFELSSTSGDIYFTVFERLNTGGVKLNDMEIRNCIYRGSLNSCVKRLSENEDFIKCLNNPRASKRMDDRSLVLRFLAFYERTHHKSHSGLKRFLNDFMETYKDVKDEKIREYEKVFEKSMKACLTIFGNQAFRLKVDSKHPNESLNSKSSGEWATRPNAAIFPVIATSFTEYDLGKITRCADSIYEEYCDLIGEDPKWVDYIRRASGNPDRIKYVFDTWQSRLRRVLSTTTEVENDSIRLFSKQLKKEIFDANPTCSLCGQKIVLIDDAALDHEEKYSNGGRTVPENATLTHRLCNLKRG
jgi:hypothetical protein